MWESEFAVSEFSTGAQFNEEASEKHDCHKSSSNSMIVWLFRCETLDFVILKLCAGFFAGNIYSQTPANVGEGDHRHGFGQTLDSGSPSEQ